jgi:AcrR family transcriptional regulator
VIINKIREKVLYPDSLSEASAVDESRLRILNAATAIFAEKGLDGARVDEIAAAAKINKRMLYHYYGNKEDLYVEVLRANLKKVGSLSFTDYDPEADPRENIRKLITKYFYFLADNETVVRLHNWEALNRGSYVAPLLAEFKNNYEDILDELLKKGLDQGLFKPDMDVVQVLLSIDALCMIYFSHNQTFRLHWKNKQETPEMLAARVNHIIDLIFNGILIKA